MEFSGNPRGFRRLDLLEDLERLTQPVRCLGGVAGGQGAPAQAGLRVGLIPGAVDLAGQVQGLLVAGSGLAEVAAYPVQGADLVERLGLSAQVAEFTVDAQRLLQVPGRAAATGCSRPRRRPAPWLCTRTVVSVPAGHRQRGRVQAAPWSARPQECARLLGEVSAVIALGDLRASPQQIAYLLEVLPGCSLVIGSADPVLGCSSSRHLAGLPEKTALALLMTGFSPTG